MEPFATPPDEARVLRRLDAILGAFQEGGPFGTVTLVVYKGRGVDVEIVVELDKVRVG